MSQYVNIGIIEFSQAHFPSSDRKLTMGLQGKTRSFLKTKGNSWLTQAANHTEKL